MAFQGNQLLRREGEKIEYSPDTIKEWIRCSEDIIYFAEKYFRIITIDEGEKIIQLYEFQKRMLKAFVTPKEGKRHSIVLSSRQIGKSTISTIYMLWYILFQKDKTVACLGNKERTAIEILKRIKFAYEFLPLWLQQGIKSDGWNKKSIILENNCRIIADSTAGSTVRGYTISLLYLDEFAFVPTNVASDFMGSAYPTILSGKTSKAIIVSTPNGLNHYHDIWKKAVAGENDYQPIKINWFEVPGRNEEFKNAYIRNRGIIEWNQDFACLGNIKSININIKNKVTGEIKNVNMEDFYENYLFDM